MYNPYSNEGLYIAGPECFYPNGYTLWNAQKGLAEFYGIPVVLPTSTVLKLDAEDKRDNAKEIFDDLIVQVGRTTAVIADLEMFRGSEPDGGTIFEMGWIWSKGGRVYGYTRDMRPMRKKNQCARLEGKTILDQDGRALAYADLPFAPSIMASAKLVEGDFAAALQLYRIDLDQERKGFKRDCNPLPAVERVPNRVFVSSSLRYRDDYEQYKEETRKAFAKKGYEAVFANDVAFGKGLDVLSNARTEFDINMRLLASSSILVADLNDFHGMEPQSDVSFECGVAWGLGMKCMAFMSDTSIMKKRIPHYDECDGGLDWADNVVENFDLPINLMFSSYFDIVEGDVMSVVDAI